MVIINYYCVISCIPEYNTLCNLESVVYLRVFSVCYVELCAVHLASVLDDKTKENTTSGGLSGIRATCAAAMAKNRRGKAKTLDWVFSQCLRDSAPSSPR